MNELLDLLGTAFAVLGMVVLFWLAMGLLYILGVWLVEEWRARQARRRAAVEAALDRQQERLQAIIYDLAAAIAQEGVAATEAKREMERVAAGCYCPLKSGVAS